MTQTFNLRTTAMPSEMQTLLNQYPRDSWDRHPGFAAKTRHWLDAHQMFRRLAAITRTEAEQFLDKSRDAQDFAGRISYYGGALVQNLHGHHGWEDHHFFPELSASDPKFDAGLEILEQDHALLDDVLGAYVASANRAIKLIQLDEKQAREEAGKLQGLSTTIEAFLDRHLTDEEELAVPIILHHRLRG